IRDRLERRGHAPRELVGERLPVRAPAAGGERGLEHVAGEPPASAVTVTRGLGSLIGAYVLLCVALLWYGGIAAAVVVSVEARQWWMIVLLMPLVAIGMFIALIFVGLFLALFSPRPTLTMSTDRAHPGDAIDIAWSFTGNLSRITRYSIRLQGASIPAMRM